MVSELCWCGPLSNTLAQTCPSTNTEIFTGSRLLCIMHGTVLTLNSMKSDMGNKTAFIRRKKVSFFNVNSLNISLRLNITT